MLFLLLIIENHLLACRNELICIPLIYATTISHVCSVNVDNPSQHPSFVSHGPQVGARIIQRKDSSLGVARCTQQFK